MFAKAISKFANVSRFLKIRYFSTCSTSKSAYDSDGKTTATMLNQEPGLGVMIDAFSQIGFRLNNGIFVVGPMIAFPKTVLSWNIRGDQDICEKSLILFSILEPKPDILIIGYGSNTIVRKFDDIYMKIKSKRKNINIEVLPTENAVTTFNFLVAEGRFVGAALVPPFKLSFEQNYYAIAKARHKELQSSDS